MATVIAPQLPEFGPRSSGILLSPRAFDRGRFEEGWRYELINGVLVVTRTPDRAERDPNEELGHWLRNYHETHPAGARLDLTLPEETVVVGDNRRRADRVLWVGLGRLPKRNETPTIIVEFVSAGRRNWIRDYETKRDEYLTAGVKEYWVFDRFARTLTVFSRAGTKAKKRTIQAHQAYQTALLPGFELPLSKLLALADRWPEDDDE